MTRIAAPTGEQFHLRHDGAHGTVEATITEVAAALRQLSVDGHALVQGFPRESTPPFGHGIVLAPWPNRVRDGRWVHEGKAMQLDITEVERGNAIHGLLRNTPYRVVEKWDDSVTLGAAIVPQHGWPFHLWTTVQYALLIGPALGRLEGLLVGKEHRRAVDLAVEQADHIGGAGHFA